MKIDVLPCDAWPPQLHEIPHQPKLLYISGTMPPPQTRFLTVVGSRHATAYGKAVVHTLITGLSGLPITIVSGLALGIDGLAHQAALEAKLHTIAIPGSGLSPTVIAPQTHANLANKIVASGGCLLSEFAPQQPSLPWMFPRRNRLMAGIAHAVLIIEATRKSGTLITAKLATDYNRDVLAVPGSIFEEQRAGPHLLLSLGATPITSVASLRETLGFDETAEHVSAVPKTISETGQVILNALSEPMTVNMLHAVTHISTNRLEQEISLLEIEGLITKTNGHIVRIN